MKKIVLFFVIFSGVVLFSKKSLGENFVDCIPDPPAGCINYMPTVDSTGKIYTFRSYDAEGELKYFVNIDSCWALKGVKAKLSNNDIFYPSYFGGFNFNHNVSGYPLYWPYSPFNKYLLSAVLDTARKELQTIWVIEVDKNEIVFTVDFQMIGRSLKVKYQLILEDADIHCKGFDLDRCELADNPHIIEVPQLPNMNLLLSNGVFTSIFFDWTKTNSTGIWPYGRDTLFSPTSAYFSQYARYECNTAQIFQPFDETIYITISPKIEDVFPNVPNPISPYINLSASTLTFDYWDDFGNAFGTTRLPLLFNSGVNDSLWTIFHTWQKNGYDVMLPDIYPLTSPRYDTLRRISDTIHAHNSLFSVHENYIGIHNDAAGWQASSNYGLTWDGNRHIIWSWPVFNGYYHMYLYKPSLCTLTSTSPSLVLQSRAIHDSSTGLNTNAAYVDYNTNNNPGAVVDLDANAPNNSTMRGTYDYYKSVGSSLRNSHHGPVSAEGGAYMAYYIGYFDDFEASIQTNYGASLTGSSKQGGFWRPLLVDFDLLKMHKKAFLHGVGYKERFYQDGGYAWRFGIGTDSVLIYIATQFAYGRGGNFQLYPTNRSLPGDSVYIFDAVMQNKCVLPMQQYLKGNPVSIQYNDGGILKSASEYIKDHPTTWNVFEDGTNNGFMGMIKIVYDNDAIVYVNRNNSNNWTVSVPQNRVIYSYNMKISGAMVQGNVYPGSSITIPAQCGWLAVGPVCEECPDEEQPIERGGKKFTFRLSQNYPNPFNPMTTIKYSLAKREFVTIKIFDILGREIMLLENTFQDEGEYSVNFDGSKLASGMYFYQINAQDYINTKKMLLIK
jgi:hypothetical protein